MKNKVMVQFSLYFLAMIVCTIMTYGAACTVYPVQGCTVATSMSFNTITSGNLTLNDTTGTGGAIAITASNIVLDFNQSKIIGNGSGFGVELQSGVTNVTIINYNITNYSRSIDVGTSGWPDFASITSNVNGTSYNYQASTKALFVSCYVAAGTCSQTYTGLTNLLGSNNVYNVYSGSTLLGSYSTDSYTQTNTGQDTIVPNANALFGLSATEGILYFLLLFVIIFAGAFLLITGNVGSGLITIVVGMGIAALLIKAWLGA